MRIMDDIEAEVRLIADDEGWDCETLLKVLFQFLGTEDIPACVGPDLIQFLWYKRYSVD